MKKVRTYFLLFAWIIACLGTLMSIYYSYLLNIEPCTLCYAQRVCLFPLTIILGIAVYRDDHAIKLYTIPLSLLGMLIAAYQICLQEFWKVSGEVCGRVSCTNKLFVWGPVTIPMASAIAFCGITILLFLSKNMSNKKR